MDAPRRAIGSPRLRALWAVVVVTVVACRANPDEPSRIADVDRSVDPCEDLYAFACNDWAGKQVELDGTNWRDRSFSGGKYMRYFDSNNLLEDARKSPSNDPGLAQLGTFYGSCMDEEAIERAGTTPFAPQLASIDNVHDPASLAMAIGALYEINANPLFKLGPAPAEADARRTIWEVWAQALGLGSETYGARDDAAKRKLSKYEHRIASVLTELRHDAAAATVDARAIVELETRLASSYPDPVTARVIKHHPEVGRAGLVAGLPHFAWDRFLAQIGVHDVGSVQITSPEYVSELDRLLISTPSSTWRAYLAFHLVDQYQGELPRRFRDLENTTSRSRYCVDVTWARLPDLMGQVYVRERFDAKRARPADAMVAALAHAMRTELAGASWLDPQTRNEAERKLANIAWLAGAPSHWKRYDVELGRATHAANLLALTRLQVSREIAMVGAPTDRELRLYSVAEPNASYVPHRNAIELPAGMWQTPYFDPDAPVAVNVGSIGMVIGHELTHAFDDQGAQYDVDGSLRNWWQPATYVEFRHRTQCVVDQYDRYTTAVGRVNGALSVGENIADIGGLKLAFAAYRQLRASNTDPGDERTDDQQFFLSFAQTFCRKATPDGYRWLLANDRHAPSEWRVNAAVSAMPEFATAFQCKTGARLAPVQRCSVW
jgi:putative endopeptidase